MKISRFSFAIRSILKNALSTTPGIAACAASAMLCATPSCGDDVPVLKVDDQSLQTRGTLEAPGQLKDLPYKIEWFNFPAAQPLGEALNAGAVDVGGLGAAPLVFALAAGARVRAVAATRSNPLDLTIVVGAQSPLNDAPEASRREALATAPRNANHLPIRCKRALV